MIILFNSQQLKQMDMECSLNQGRNSYPLTMKVNNNTIAINYLFNDPINYLLNNTFNLLIN